jgi:hypothetical protein
VQRSATVVGGGTPGLADILVRVPPWVWVVFVVLLVVGLKLTRPMNTRPVVSIAVSAGLLAWSLSGVIGTFDAHALPLLAWGAGLVVAFVAGSRVVAPDGLRMVDASRVHVPGSWVPLIAMMGIFVLRFVNGVAVGANLPVAVHPAYAPVMAGLLGACSGLFMARAWSITRFARAQRVFGMRAAAVR